MSAPATVAFPPLPPELERSWPAGLRLVGFGALGESVVLSINFFDQPRSDVAVFVVAATAEPTLSAEQVAALPIGIRIRALLRILSHECSHASVRLSCQECGDSLEVDLPLAELVDLGKPISSVDVNGATIRLPTGLDQQNWRETGLDLSSLVANGNVEGAMEALSAADPLVAFRISSQCPRCSTEIDHPIDLENLCLRRFAATQERLIAEVARLAAGYGWSEASILALPRWRRRRYAEQLEALRA